ncbi:unnamed protein product, partial [Vitis vinifera]
MKLIKKRFIMFFIINLGGHANCNYACGPGIASGVALLYLMLNPHLHSTFFYDQFLHQSLINLDDISCQFWMPSLEKYFFFINRNMLMQVYLIQTPSRVAFVCQFHKLRWFWLYSYLSGVKAREVRVRLIISLSLSLKSIMDFLQLNQSTSPHFYPL